MILAWQNRPPKAWHFAVTMVLLVIAFTGYFLGASIKCRCYLSSWHGAQATAGLAFVALALARTLVALFMRDPRFRWEIYAGLTLLSPLWIPAVFQTVLAIRDLYFG